jgi:hypothetical protein
MVTSFVRQRQTCPAVMVGSDLVICQTCGSKLGVIREESVQGLYCPKCSWSVVTTSFPPALLDETVYEILLLVGSANDTSQIRAIASIANVNLLGARKLIQGAPAVILRGEAGEIMEAIVKLKTTKAEFTIRPEFRWKLDDFE